MFCCSSLDGLKQRGSQGLDHMEPFQQSMKLECYLSIMRSHWKTLSRVVTWYAFSFKMITLATIRKRMARVEAGRLQVSKGQKWGSLVGLTKAVKFWICLEIKVITFHDGLEVGCDQSEGRRINLLFFDLRNLPNQKHEFSLGSVCLKMAILQVQALTRWLDVWA